MDVNDLRSVTTVLMLAVFIGIVWWAFSARTKTSFEEAGRLPLDEDLGSVEKGHGGQQDK
jgi:cytochrome c oxidase cbb3-type subunit 4